MSPRNWLSVAAILLVIVAIAGAAYYYNQVPARDIPAVLPGKYLPPPQTNTVVLPSSNQQQNSGSASAVKLMANGISGHPTFTIDQRITLSWVVPVSATDCRLSGTGNYAMGGRLGYEPVVYIGSTGQKIQEGPETFGPGTETPNVPGESDLTLVCYAGTRFLGQDFIDITAR